MKRPDGSVFNVFNVFEVFEGGRTRKEKVGRGWGEAINDNTQRGGAVAGGVRVCVCVMSCGCNLSRAADWHCCAGSSSNVRVGTSRQSSAHRESGRCLTKRRRMIKKNPIHREREREGRKEKGEKKYTRTPRCAEQNYKRNEREKGKTRRTDWSTWQHAVPVIPLVNSAE